MASSGMPRHRRARDAFPNLRGRSSAGAGGWLTAGEAGRIRSMRPPVSLRKGADSVCREKPSAVNVHHTGPVRAAGTGERALPGVSDAVFLALAAGLGHRGADSFDAK